jgi:hypothetical protein
VIVGLFNDALSSSEFIKHGITWENDQELKFIRLSAQAVLAQFKALLQSLLSEAEESYGYI